MRLIISQSLRNYQKINLLIQYKLVLTEDTVIHKLPEIFLEGRFGIASLQSVEFNVLRQPRLLRKLENSMDCCHFQPLQDVVLQISVMDDIFFLFSEVWY